MRRPRLPHPLTIRQHLALFATALALPLLGALVYARQAERSNARAAADAAAVQLSRLASAGVAQFIDQSRLLMRRASRDPIAVAGAGRCAPALRQLPELRPEFSSVAVIRPDGKISCSVPATDAALEPFGGRSLVQAVRGLQRFAIVTRRSGGRRATIFALPWRERGVVRGYLAVRVDLRRYQEPFTHLALPREAVLGIVDGDGALQARSLESARAVGRRYDPVPAAGRETVTGVGRDGVRRIYAATAVAGTHWRAYAGLSTDSAFAASERLARAMLVAAIAGIVLAAAAGLAVSRRIIRPIRHLGAVAARIAAGDTDARAAVAGPVEVAATATEFNVMIDRAAEVESARGTALQRVAHAEKMEAIGRLAGGVAHDFNNLLLAIRGYTELAIEQRARAGDGDGDAELREVLRAAERAVRLTRQLLAFGRRQPGSPEPADVGEVVADMETLLRRLIGEDVELVCVRPQQPLVVLADRGQLEQIILNLAVNARDAMPHGGRLTIEVSELERAGVDGQPPARHALLAVTDTGCGMDEETAARIFEPFFSTKGDRGTGLGLATVHTIVSQNRGEIVVESEPGHGAAFRVSLPIHERATESTPAGAPAASPLPVRRSGTILLVEDDPGVRHVVGTMLAGSGLHVLSAGGGEAAIALAAARPGPIELLITDLVMPGFSGPETARRIRATRPDLNVLYMSGYADDPVYRGGIALVSDGGFIQKPFDTAELLRAIDAVLALRPRLDGVGGGAIGAPG